MPGKTLLRNLRLVSGLVLMLFVIGHLINLALGLHSLAAMGEARVLLLDPWRSAIGATLLGGAALVHTALGLYALATRRAMAMSRTDAVQLALGLLTPPMLITHVVATHIAGEFGRDFEFVYGQMLAVYWSFAPHYAFQQLFVVMIVWIHGALGLYSWLVLKPVWRRIGGVVLPVLFAVPILALLGFAESGRAVLQRLDTDPAWKTLIIEHLRPIAAMVAELDGAKSVVLTVYAVLVALALAVVAARMLRDRARPVQVGYDGGQVAQGRRGLSILELSQAGDIAHAHVCSGRGRCGTCRVRVEQGAASLSPLNDLEHRTLGRVHAASGTRLACQARVLGTGVVVTRLLPPYADASAARAPREWVDSALPADGPEPEPEPAA
jgi:adenylate cyclase